MRRYRARGRVSRKARFTAKRRPSSSVIITAAAYAHARLRARLQAVFYGPARKFRRRNTAAPNRDIGIRLAADRAPREIISAVCRRETLARSVKSPKLIITYE